MHKQDWGICADCMRDGGHENVQDDPVDTNRPKIRGKHMMIQKSQAQILMERRKRELGRRFY
jgi:hypothetical protein